MFEKNLTISYPLDFYGELLADRRRELMSLYYNEDYSLSEIAAEVGISRQGVRDTIKRGEEELQHFEDKLGMAARFAELQAFSPPPMPRCCPLLCVKPSWTSASGSNNPKKGFTRCSKACPTN